eukprot:CAMPEP_0198204280 /NCGR_PEP_ID=MMETSP1445-20131203/7689_1 /TAXON_ID=36898 /ORGANISM="Pyramimonas sp., Strain CCMP2087" /LENGTH=158 /DNA_ID=CAMNT_0043876083 /DNA_START=204 /DNA_END=680 /DNA_ORIENTATION=+
MNLCCCCGWKKRRAAAAASREEGTELKSAKVKDKDIAARDVRTRTLNPRDVIVDIDNNTSARLEDIPPRAAPRQSSKHPRKPAKQDPRYVAKIRREERRKIKEEKNKLASEPVIIPPEASEEEWETGSSATTSETKSSRGSSATSSQSSVEEGACVIV